MRYLADRPFVAANGKSFTITNVKGTDRIASEATVGELLHWLLNSYQPQVLLNLGQPPLGNADLRSLNRAIDILEGEPQEIDGYYRFEDQDFAVVKKVVIAMAPVLTPRNSPILEDLLDEAPKTLIRPLPLSPTVQQEIDDIERKSRPGPPEDKQVAPSENK